MKISNVINIILGAFLVVSILVSIVIVYDKQLKLVEYNNQKVKIVLYELQVNLRNSYLRQIKTARAFKNDKKIDIVINLWDATKTVEKQTEAILAGRDVTMD